MRRGGLEEAAPGSKRPEPPAGRAAPRLAVPHAAAETHTQRRRGHGHQYSDSERIMIVWGSPVYIL